MAVETEARPVVAGGAAVTEAPTALGAKRFMSVDALRGFDMFWIVGGEHVVRALKGVDSNDLTRFLAGQFQHKYWTGFAFYDLIFPLFIFLVGMSTAFSLGRIVEQEGKRAAYARLFRRAALLYVLGFLIHGGFRQPWPGVRFVGVLQRIAAAYLGAGLLYLNFRVRGIAIACVAILAGYWALIVFVPPPGVPVPSTLMGHNWASYVDSRFLPGLKTTGHWDTEGLLPTVPAVATALLGLLAGTALLREGVPDRRKALELMGAGLCAVAAGYLWGFEFPVIKKMWTSSFVLVAGGYSCLLVGAFHWLIEAKDYRRWALPFVWIGANALAVYVAAQAIDFRDWAERVAGGDIKAALGPYGEILVTVLALGFVFLLARFLYRRRIFLRL